MPGKENQSLLKALALPLLLSPGGGINYHSDQLRGVQT